MKILIKNALTVLDDLSSKETNVCIENGIITALGDVPQDFKPDEIISGKGRLLIPGLVNAHTHAYMTVLRGCADDLDFNTWLFKRVMPAEESLTPDEAYFSALLGCAEMLSGGVTSFLDMHMFPGASVKAAKQSGMRAVISRGLSGGVNDMDGGKRRLREARGEISEYSGDELISFMIAPHAMYTCDQGYLREIAETANTLKCPIHTHLSETQYEVSTCREQYGCSPVELYDRCGLLSNTTVAAHCVNLSDDDISLLAERGVNIAVNSSSNMKLGNGFAPVPKLASAGINLCLGTDSTASNNSLSILREMQLVTMIHKGVSLDPTCITAKQGFAMATVNGAKALGFGDTLGSIKVGAKADLALFPIDRPDMIPLSDSVSALCYSSAGLRADTVIVNGKPVIKKGEFLTIDMEQVTYEINKTAKRLGLI